MKNKFKSVLFFGILLMIADQALKLIISGKFALNSNFILIKDILSLRLVHNTGAAFSILSDNRLLLIGISVFVLVFLCVYLMSMDTLDDFGIFTYSLLIGGILGNLMDRIFRGFIVDYLALQAFGFKFPVFNFADVCIVLSIVLLLFTTVKGDVWNG